MTMVLSGTNGVTYPDGFTHPSGNGRLLGVRVFTTADNGSTYTPTTGTKSVIVEVVGGGGAGGGAMATSSTQYSYGIGGLSGQYGKSYYASGFSGVTLTIGAGGTGVSGGTGGAGGNSSFGSLLTCPGGSGGVAINQVGLSQVSIYGAEPTALAVTGANLVQHAGFPGVYGVSNGGFDTFSGGGCSTLLGAGGRTVANTNSTGNPGTGYGSGGSGACNNTSSAARAGGNGAPGVIIVWEYA